MTTALVKTVQSTGDIKGEENAQKKYIWKWTKKKRKAITYILQGWPDIKIAEMLGVHRNTVRNWKQVQEFHAAVITAAKEYVNRRRFQRVHETGVLTDNLSLLAAKKLKKLIEKEEEFGQVDLNTMQLLLREYREFRGVERGDFGDDVHRVEGGLNINVTGLGGTDLKEKSSQSFKKFVAENADKVTRSIIESPLDPQKALVETTRELLKATPLLDELYVEEKDKEDKDDSR